MEWSKMGEVSLCVEVWHVVRKWGYPEEVEREVL